MAAEIATTSLATSSLQQLGPALNSALFIGRGGATIAAASSLASAVSSATEQGLLLRGGIRNKKQQNEVKIE
eukprot:CAMPEP_0195299304 /NCGR_PEP_ID=MMETSP0707-20130614/25294_1 /TAXON_ID=33640 /ORGANISM="Asterionellopsis glacialis, Strain CCMP134" /LENGTH=71 /DNA_ID=CAMNT_0040361673 /DNA_START=51 /DNA_END=263 /DNA_ORIENTATION=+